MYLRDKLPIEAPTAPLEAARREMLIAALRDRSMWPRGFEYEWSSCGTCAMGLCAAMAGGKLVPIPLHVGPFLGLSGIEAAFLFGTTLWNGGVKPTPEQIADRLELLHRARALARSTDPPTRAEI